MKLKKLFAGVVAAAMMLTMAVPAFATEGSAPSDTPASSKIPALTLDADDTIELTKNYLVRKGTAPAETFNFTLHYEGSEDLGTNVTAPSISDITFKAAFGDLASSNTAYTQRIVKTTDGSGLKVSDLGIRGIGKYIYSVKEANNGTPGVDYNEQDTTNALYIVVQATYQLNADDTPNTTAPLAYYVTLHRGSPEGGKTTGADAFTNYYGKDSEGNDTVFSIDLTKIVHGKFSDVNTPYHFTVSLIGADGKPYYGATYTYNGTSDKIAISGSKDFQLKHKDTLTLNNIPAGVTYTITETDNLGNDWSTTYTVGTAAAVDGKRVSSADTGITADTSITFTNTHNGVPDTGVILDNAPYIALLTIVAVGAVFMVIKKRRNYED